MCAWLDRWSSTALVNQIVHTGAGARLQPLAKLLNSYQRLSMGVKVLNRVDSNEG